MMATGVLGGVSMVMGMFADDAGEARRSMILMNISMAPMMLSMMGFNQAMLKNISTSVAAVAANGSLAASFRALGAAIMPVVTKVALITAAGLALTFLIDMAIGAKDEVVDLNNELMTFTALSAEDLHQAYADFSTDSYADVGVAISDVSEEIQNTEKAAQSLEGAERAMHQHKIDRLTEELHMLQQIQAIKGGEEGLAMLEKWAKQKQKIL